MDNILEIDIGGLENESDVEQKFIYKVLTKPYPWGLGIEDEYIKTKKYIKKVLIGKRNNRKQYFPDYVVSISGIPVLIVEAKAPGDGVGEGFRETRLYATEINSQFSSGVNPIRFIISSDFERTVAGKWDDDTPNFDFSFESISPESKSYGRFLENMNRNKLEDYAKEFINKNLPRKYYKAKKMLGGSMVQNEEIGLNGFGEEISFNFKHIFNPRTKKDRSYIVKNAYVASERRRRYVDSIDRIIDAAKPPSIKDPVTIEDTESPDEIIDEIRKEDKMKNQIIILVGRVGSGKSTFIDYLREVALPKDVRESVLWSQVDMNEAPSDTSRLYDWTCKQLIEDIAAKFDKSFETGSDLRNLFHPEIKDIEGRLSTVYEEREAEYKSKLFDEIKGLIEDQETRLNAYFRHLGAERDKLPVAVLDNVDRGDRDAQLEMFKLARWIQNQFQVLVILPIREQTYDSHRDRPPLDTAIKDLTFRIESPPFQEVLNRRIDLAVKEISEMNGGDELYYYTSTGARVSYKPEDQASYLESFRKSLFEYGSFIRNMITGLSGRNIREAMEIFLDFCKSGHITNDQILKLRTQDGDFTLPYDTLSRVAFRTKSRYFDDKKGYVKNLFDPSRDDENPTHFSRLLILKWLDDKEDVSGPKGVEGFHRLKNMKEDLRTLGMEEQIIQRESIELLRSKCIITEHLKKDTLKNEDLIRISPAGKIHLQITRNIQYLSSVAEDTWVSDEDLAKNVMKRIKNPEFQYKKRNEIKNALEFVNYLKKKLDTTNACEEVFESSKPTDLRETLSDISSKVNGSKGGLNDRDPWYVLEKKLDVGDQVDAVIQNIDSEYGLFITLEKVKGNKAVGLLHKSNIPSREDINDFKIGQEVKVVINSLEPEVEKASLDFA